MLIGLFFVVTVSAAHTAPMHQTIQTPEGELVIDHAKATLTYQGVESSFIVDELQGVTGENVKDTTRSPDGFVHKPYYDFAGNVSLDVYIEEDFYYANQAALDDFWDKFNERFELLKNITGWSSKRLFGVPLEIYNYGHTAACYGGNASPTHSNVVFSNPMYKTGCNKPYYTTFNGTPLWNNPGELGDWWPYMNTALHEAQHSISPYPIYTRSWLTEGFSEYLMYNVQAEYGDIPQATADTYLYKGFAGYQWDPYVANDYHDTTIYNRELQRSHGYDITGWMFSKMRYEEGMDWDKFFFLINNNKESLDYPLFNSGTLTPYIYYTDAFIINVFGKAMNHTNYWAQTDVLFNYYSGGGTDGHGYGARNISYSWHPTQPQPYSDFDWFGDVSPTIDVSNDTPEENETVTITATVYNLGDVNLKNISIRIYADEQLLVEEFKDINKNSNQQVSTTYSDTVGDHLVEVRVDEGQIKIEGNESNNNAQETISISYGPMAPVLEPLDNITVKELGTVTIRPEASDLNNDTLTFGIDSPWFSWENHAFRWQTTPTSAGSYLFKVNVTDGLFWDEAYVGVTVVDRCKTYDKLNQCWIGCTCLTDSIDPGLQSVLR